VHDALESFNFNEAASSVYKFVWNEYCDWYIEMCKGPLAAEGGGKRAAQNVLAYALEASLRLLHPFMPFITEEIWQKLPVAGESIMVAPFPEFDASGHAPEVEFSMGLVMDVIAGVRNIRGEMNLSPGLTLSVMVKTDNPWQERTLKGHVNYIKELARIDSFSAGPDIVKPEVAASSALDGMDLFVPLEGLMDFAEEKNRIEKELKKMEKDSIVLSSKLSNQNFVQKAPPEVIEKDRQRLLAISEKQARLKDHLKTIEQAIR
jgi:valyl-tRNA synthetase